MRLLPSRRNLGGSLAAIVATFVTLAIAACAIDCPDTSWVQEGDSCFKLIQEEFGRTQSQAQAHCRELHDFSGLLWLDSEAEKLWVRRYGWDLRRQRDKCRDCDRLLDAAWVGLFREPQPPYNFYWEKGNGPTEVDTLLSRTDWFWHSGHPKPPTDGMFKAALTEATNTSGNLYRTNFGTEKLWHICKVRDPITTTAPTTTALAATGPTTTERATAESTATEPTTTDGKTMELTTAESKTTEPTTAELTTTEPTTTEPMATEPTTTEPTATEPTTTEPTATEPTTTEPTTAEPTTAEPATTEPTTAEPTTVESTTTEPTTIATVEPLITKSTTTESATTRPTTTESTTTESTTTGFTTTEDATTKFTTAIPTTAESSVTKSTTIRPTTTESIIIEPTTNEALTTTGTMKSTSLTDAESTIWQVTTDSVSTLDPETETDGTEKTVDSPSTQTSILLTTEHQFLSTAETLAATRAPPAVNDGWFVSLLSEWLIAAAVIATATIVAVSVVALYLRVSRVTYANVTVFTRSARVAPEPLIPSVDGSGPAGTQGRLEVRAEDNDIEEVILIT